MSLSISSHVIGFENKTVFLKEQMLLVSYKHLMRVTEFYFFHAIAAPRSSFQPKWLQSSATNELFAVRQVFHQNSTVHKKITYSIILNLQGKDGNGSSWQMQEFERIERVEAEWKQERWRGMQK